MNQEIEIEIKFPLNNPLDVIKFLQTKAMPDKNQVWQKDTYYAPKHRDFLSFKYPYEWLRLRQTAKGASLDYKHFHPENIEVTEYCDEYQTSISEPVKLAKILKSLDFKEIIVVEKTRSTWMYKDAEIAIDEVRNLGTFIELELKKHVNTAKEGKEYLRQILLELSADVGNEDIRGYPFRILENRGYVFGKK